MNGARILPPLHSTDQFLRLVLASRAVDSGPYSPVRLVQSTLAPILAAWGNGHLKSTHPSGSFAKGTANRGATDIDLFLSVSDTAPNTLADIHDTLFRALKLQGYNPRRQRVSIRVKVGIYEVDLVPGKVQPSLDGSHSLYLRKGDTWTKTNVARHIQLVRGSGLIEEIRLLKLWRDRYQLSLPSFYLELAVLRALEGMMRGQLATNVFWCLRYLANDFADDRFVDPSNSANVISDDLTYLEKLNVAGSARTSLSTQWRDLF
jgi:hypothetical protein